MSTFECKVVKATVVPHPNADAIEICMVGDFRSIVKKDTVKTGDLVVYIPEMAILPMWLMKKMGFWDEYGQRGMLHGGGRNRVKAIRLRGVVSQGIILTGTGDANEICVVSEPYDGNQGGFMCKEGDDVAEFLGVVKYEPSLPSHMKGRAICVDFEATHNYDFDNLKKTPDMFTDGETVVISEKIHGTLLQVCVVPTAKTNERYYKGRVVMSSKGLGGKGVVLDPSDSANLYAQAVTKWDLMEKALTVLGPIADDCQKPVFLFGEVFGNTLSNKGIQDLTYAGVQVDYRAFDICIGNRGNQEFAPFHAFVDGCRKMSIPYVPILYVGDYSKEKVLELTDGDTVITQLGPLGEALAHIREGVVVKSFMEGKTVRGERKIAKSVSDAYLLRKGEVTEFN